MATAEPNQRRTYADHVYTLLRAAGIADVSYDNEFTVTAGPVRVHINPDGTAVTFTDPYSDLPATVHIGQSWHYTVTATVVTGLVTQLVPTPTDTMLSAVWTRLVKLHRTYDRRLDDEHADRQHLLESLLRELYVLADDLGNREVS